MTTSTGADRPTITVPSCPDCATALELGSRGTVDSWSCPQGHGLAMTLSEAHGRLQDDEIAVLWQTARHAPAGTRKSPFSPHRPMVRVTLPYDSDEIPEGEPGDGPDEGSVELDVDLDQQFIWFDAGELDELPEDLPNTPPSAEEQARVAEIRARFAADIDRALDARDDHELSERLYQRIARRPGLHRALDRLGRTVTSY
jgi:Zn-finger nucleic acid-binding protein